MGTNADRARLSLLLLASVGGCAHQAAAPGGCARTPTRERTLARVEVDPTDAARLAALAGCTEVVGVYSNRAMLRVAEDERPGLASAGFGVAPWPAESTVPVFADLVPSSPRFGALEDAGEVVASYARQSLLRLTPAALLRLERELPEVGFRVAAELEVVELPHLKIDLARFELAEPPGWPRFSGPGYWWVIFVGPATPEWLEELRRGGRLVHSASPTAPTALVWLDTPDDLESRPFVARAIPWAASLKVPLPALGLPQHRGAWGPPARWGGGDPITVELAYFALRPDARARVATALEALGAKAVAGGPPQAIRARIPRARLPEVAAIPELRSIAALD